jgi:hypothetical protein
VVGYQDGLPDLDVPPKVWVYDKVAKERKERAHQQGCQHGGERNRPFQEGFQWSFHFEFRFSSF